MKNLIVAQWTQYMIRKALQSIWESFSLPFLQPCSLVQAPISSTIHCPDNFSSLDFWKSGLTEMNSYFGLQMFRKICSLFKVSWKIEVKLKLMICSNYIWYQRRNFDNFVKGIKECGSKFEKFIALWPNILFDYEARILEVCISPLDYLLYSVMKDVW